MTPLYMRREMPNKISAHRQPGSRPLPGRRERFAQLVAAGSTQSDAYASAGYSRDPSNAAKLANDNSVAERVDWLHGQACAEIKEVISKRAADEAFTREWVLEKLKQNAMRALGDLPVSRRVVRHGRVYEEQVVIHNFAAANRALELLGQELGMFKGDGAQAPAPNLDVPKSVEDPRIIAQLERYREKQRAGLTPRSPQAPCDDARQKRARDRLIFLACTS